MKKIFIMFILVKVSLFSNDNISNVLKDIDSVLVDKDAKYLVEMVVNRNKKKSNYELLILVKGRNFVSKVESPLFDKGTIFLMKDERSWVYYPKTDKTISTSGNQNMLGSDFTFNEVTGISLLEGYDSDILNITETELEDLQFINEDISKIKSDGIVIHCKAKEEKNVPYPEVRVFAIKIDNKYYPVREEFYTKSGRLLGILIFENITEISGKIRPLKITMRSTLNEKNYSEIIYKKAKFNSKTPDLYFTEPYMRTLGNK